MLIVLLVNIISEIFDISGHIFVHAMYNVTPASSDSHLELYCYCIIYLFLRHQSSELSPYLCNLVASQHVDIGASYKWDTFGVY